MPEVDYFAEPTLFGDDEDYLSDLFDRFIMPPYSVLDRKQGSWIRRKKQWLALGIKSELGRSENLIWAPVGDNPSDMVQRMRGVVEGTSVFDPVIVELAVRWYSAPGGTVLDPFAGGSVRGIVASLLGRNYLGIDLRADQIKANREQGSIASPDFSPIWVAGDSEKVLDSVEPESVDLVFTCPPYFDLEVYSDDPDDLSNMDWESFLTSYYEIIRKSAKALKEDRFAVFVIGEVRDKKGFIRGLIPETITAFKEAGLNYYNNGITLDPQATAALRANRFFNSGRKLVTVHQHFMVFVKGDPKKATDYCKAGEEDDDAGTDFLD
jgi:DNA modification methylase